MKYFLEPTDIEDGIIFPQKKNHTGSNKLLKQYTLVILDKFSKKFSNKNYTNILYKMLRRKNTELLSKHLTGLMDQGKLSEHTDTWDIKSELTSSLWRKKTFQAKGTLGAKSGRRKAHGMCEELKGS